MARGPSPDQIDLIATKTAAGLSTGVIGQLLGMSRNAVSGVIFRLRQAGDPRVPPAGQGAAVTAAQQRDALAEAFASGASDLFEAGKISGLSITIAHRRWGEVRAGLGWQAR